MYNTTVMKTKPAFLKRVVDFFLPKNPEGKEEFKEVVPFFLLISAAMIFMYAVYVRQVGTTLMQAIFTILMLVHMVIYWMVFRFVYRPNHIRWYFLFQGLLAFGISLMSPDFGLVVGLFSSLIGNAVGALRKNKDIVFVIAGFILLEVLAIGIITGLSVLKEWVPVALPSILFSGFIAYMFRRQLEVRERTQNLLDELREAHAQLEAYAARVEELTLTTERQRMARELHDTLAQGLTGLILQLEAVSTHIEKENNARAQQILQEAMAQSRTTLAESRQVIDNLRSGKVEETSFANAFQQEVSRFEEVSGIPCETKLSLTHPLPVEIRDQLTRIISEGLNNVAKHANASQARVNLNESQHHLILEVEDDGKGFHYAEERGKAGHYGLLGIAERVAMLGGELSVDSRPGEGTCLLIQIPLHTLGDIHD